MSRGSNGSPEPQEESGTPKPKRGRPEDVRVNLVRSGKGSEGVFPGPRQTAVLLKQYREHRERNQK